MESNQRYYASLEQRRAGEQESGDAESGARRTEESAGWSGRAPLPSAEALYTEVGMKAFAAFSHCLEMFSDAGRRGPNQAIDEERLARTLKQAAESAVHHANLSLQEDLSAFRDRLNRLESVLNGLDAGVKRIDKFTLDAFRNFGTLERDLSKLNERLAEIEQGGLDPQNVPARRLSKERAAKLALEAGARLRADDERISLASVAREANLKYGQVMYAFGNKEAFEEALETYLENEAEQADHEDSAPTQEIA